MYALFFYTIKGETHVDDWCRTGSQTSRRLDHCNIVSLLYFFYTSGEKKDEIYLNLVLEYIPETVYKVARQYSKQKQTIPVTFIKLYMYQLFR